MLNPVQPREMATHNCTSSSSSPESNLINRKSSRDKSNCCDCVGFKAACISSGRKCACIRAGRRCETMGCVKRCENSEVLLYEPRIRKTRVSLDADCDQSEDANSVSSSTESDCTIQDDYQPVQGEDVSEEEGDGEQYSQDPDYQPEPVDEDDDYDADYPCTTEDSEDSERNEEKGTGQIVQALIQLNRHPSNNSEAVESVSEPPRLVNYGSSDDDDTGTVSIGEATQANNPSNRSDLGWNASSLSQLASPNQSVSMFQAKRHKNKLVQECLELGFEAKRQKLHGEMNSYFDEAQRILTTITQAYQNGYIHPIPNILWTIQTACRFIELGQQEQAQVVDKVLYEHLDSEQYEAAPKQ